MGFSIHDRREPRFRPLETLRHSQRLTNGAVLFQHRAQPRFKSRPGFPGHNSTRGLATKTDE